MSVRAARRVSGRSPDSISEMRRLMTLPRTSSRYCSTSSITGQSSSRSGTSECEWHWSGSSTLGSIPRSKMVRYERGPTGFALSSRESRMFANVGRCPM